MKLWIKNPLAILADEAAGGVVVEQSRIVELVPADATPASYDQVFDASSHVVIPGLVNTHHHFFQTLFRAHPAAINKELFDWLKTLYPLWAQVDPEDFRLGTRLALTELLMSGCTTVSDHHFLYPPGLEDAMDVEDDEAAKLGMRMTLTRGTVNLPAKDGGIADDRVIQDVDVILADCERVLKRYHDPRPGAFRQVALAPCAPFNVTRDIMVETARLAERYDCRLHTHLAETKDEDTYCQEHFGCRPLDYLEELGWLSDRTWLAHGIHFNDAEVARLGHHHVGICHCPTSNMVLASGACRTRELESSGAIVGLGVDGSASNDNSNLMESVRHALMLGRLTYGSAAVTHFDVLRWATEGSARCLGRADIGRIDVGCEADLVFYCLDELRFSGAGDPLAALVLCGAHRADRVMIGGVWRVIDGVPIGADLERLRFEHSRAAKRFLSLI